MATVASPLFTGNEPVFDGINLLLKYDYGVPRVPGAPQKFSSGFQTFLDAINSSDQLRASVWAFNNSNGVFSVDLTTSDDGPVLAPSLHYTYAEMEGSTVTVVNRIHLEPEYIVRTGGTPLSPAAPSEWVFLETIRVVSHEVSHAQRGKANFDELNSDWMALNNGPKSEIAASNYINSRISSNLAEEGRAYIANWNAIQAYTGSKQKTLQFLGSHYADLASHADANGVLNPEDPATLLAAMNFTATLRPSGQNGIDKFSYVGYYTSSDISALVANGFLRPGMTLTLDRFGPIDLFMAGVRGEYKFTDPATGNTTSFVGGKMSDSNVGGVGGDFTTKVQRGADSIEWRHWNTKYRGEEIVTNDELIINRNGKLYFVPSVYALRGGNGVLSAQQRDQLAKGDFSVLDDVLSNGSGVFLASNTPQGIEYRNAAGEIERVRGSINVVPTDPLSTKDSAKAIASGAGVELGVAGMSALANALSDFPVGTAIGTDGPSGVLVGPDGVEVGTYRRVDGGIQLKDNTGNTATIFADSRVERSTAAGSELVSVQFEAGGRIYSIAGRRQGDGTSLKIEFSTSGDILSSRDLGGGKIDRLVLSKDGTISWMETRPNEHGGTTTTEFDAAREVVSQTIIKPINGGQQTEVELTRNDGSGERYVLDSSGKLVGEKITKPKYSQTLFTAIQDAADLIEAIKSGKPLPTLVSGLKLANTLDRKGELPGLGTAATVGTAALSIYNLAEALKRGEGLAVLSSAANTVAAVGAAVSAVSGTSNAVTEFFGSSVGSKLLPALNLLVAIKNHDALGVATAVASVLGPLLATPVGWVLAVAQLARAMKDTPESWGMGHFEFNPDGTLGFMSSGEGVGPAKIEFVMNGNGKGRTDPEYFGGVRGYLQGLVDKANAENPQEPLGLIPQRMPSIIWREARQSDPGYTVIDADPLTGLPKLPSLRYDDDMRPFNAEGTSQDERYSLMERLIISSLGRDAIAPVWEVRTAQMQQQAGDPLAGLTEVMRAGRRNYLAQLDSSGRPISGGKFRPVALDLNGDGQVTVVTGASSNRLFNWDDSGFDKSVGWVGSSEGLLFLDRNPNGQVDGGTELFSNSRVIDAARGLRSLDAVDANGDNLINSIDPVFEELRIWQDLNGDGRSTSNELKKLAELGITELDYKNSRFTRNGQLHSMESPDLEASHEGQRSSVTPEGIKVELSDGTVKVYASRVDDKSLYPGVASIDAAESLEGSPLDFAVRLSAPSAGITTVQVALRAGSASAGDDFGAAMQVSFDGGRTFEAVVNGLVRVPAHVPMFTLRVPTVADTYTEGSETVQLQATTPANLVPAVAVGTIRNVDVARSVASIEAPVTVSETDGFVEVAFKLSSAAPNPVTVNWRTLDAGATTGVDYMGLSSGQIVFAAGETSKIYRIPLINDGEVEPIEDFKVQITSVVGADMGVVQKTISIVSEDRPPAVLKVDSIYPSSNVDEGDPVTFNVGLNIVVGANGGAPVPLRLTMGNEWSSMAALASAPVKVSFNNGATWSSTSTDAYGDLNLIAPQGARNFLVLVPTEYDTTRLDRTLRLATPDQTMAGAATVRDRGTSNVYFVTDVASAAETGAQLTYKLKLDYARNTPVTVNVAAAAGGTAIEGSDYSILTKTVTFAAGETTKDVVVQINKDAVVEGDESFKLTLLNPVGATLSAGSTTAGTIITDTTELLRVSSIDAFAAPEGSYVEFQVNLSAAAVSATGVNLELLDGTAVGGQDYVNEILVSFDGGGSYTSAGASASTSVVVPGGTSSFRVRVAVSSDLVRDPDETFSLRAKLVGEPAADWRTGIATITDVAPPRLDIVADAASIAENGSKIAYTVHLSGPVASTVTVNYSAAGHSATVDSDFRLLPQGDGTHTLTFAPGETTKRIEVQVLDDSTYEGAESFSVQLGTVTGMAVLGNAAIATTRIDEDDAAPPPPFTVVNDALSSAQEDIAQTFSIADLLRNDSFGGVAGNDTAAGLTITGFSAGTGVQSIQRTGDSFELRFVPNFNGTATFSYDVKASDGRTATGRATLEITPVADAPIVRFVADQKPIYGWAPAITRSRAGSPQDGGYYDVVTATPGQGIPIHAPYHIISAQQYWNFGDGGPVPSGIWDEYDIPYDWFQQQVADTAAEYARNGWEPPQFITVNINGSPIEFSTTGVVPVARNNIIGWESSNDGHLEVTDVDDPSREGTYVITNITVPNQTNTGRIDSFSGSSFQFVGERYVDVDVAGRPVGKNVFTDTHGRNEPVGLSTVQGTLTNSAGRSVAFTIDVPHFGPPPSPNIYNGSKKPIAIDLNGDGFHFTDIDDSNVFFDVNGDGWRRKIAWNNPQDGFIVLDKNRDGKITDFDELSFVPYKPDGQSDLEGLKAFDTNGDGAFSAADADWSKFGVWRDANSNGVTDTGELLTLESLGIQRIELSSDGKLQVVNGQSVTGQGRALKTDGSSYAIADVTLKYRDVTVVTPTDGSAPYVVAVPKYQPGQTFEGTSGKDLILGAAGSDQFHAGDGDDVIHDDGGNDHVQAGAGDDVVFTGMDNDVVEAGAGNDQVFAGVGDDLVFGEEGDDLLVLEGGNDIAFGGAGHDNMSGGNGNDALSGDDGDDKLFGEGGWDALFGQDGDDELRGMDGNDHLDGGAGNDLLLGGTGEDAMDGGVGDDTYEVDSVGDQVIEASNAGVDTVLASISYTLSQAANVENITLTGAADLNATGDDGDNRLTGNDGKNLLMGGGGHDKLDGGAGADTLQGGKGDDTYYVDSVLDVVNELADEGTDLVVSRADFVAPDNVENVTLIGVAATVVTGNALDNVLTGNEYDNLLDGRVGADTLIGGEGNDRYYIESTGDVVIEALGGGYDTVVSGIHSVTLAANVEALELLADGVEGIGNALDNYIVGNAADNELQGLAGNDVITGGQGDDSLDGGEGNDRLSGGAGADVMRGGLGDDQYLVDSAADSVYEAVAAGVDTVTVTGVDAYALTDNVENLVLGAGSRRGAGNVLANTIQGSTSANEIYGFEGDDVIVDTGGSDLIEGGDGNDTITDSGSGTNTLRGGAGNDTINVDAASINTVSGDAGNDTINVSFTSGGMAYLGVNVIDSGAGDDVINTGAGTDTLSFGRGDGVDTWKDDANGGVTGGTAGSDTLSFKTGVRLEDLRLSRDGQDLVISLAPESPNSTAIDKLLLKSWYASEAHRIEVLKFADGTTISPQLLDQLTTAQYGSDSADMLTGTSQSDVIFGLGGNDTIKGMEGDDLLFGGDGDDSFLLLDGQVAANGVDQYDGGTGVNTILGGTGYTTLSVMSGLANLKNIQVLNGGDSNPYNNKILATSGNDVLDFSAMTVTSFTIDAAEGDDTVTGTSGNDWILGGAGNDVLNGGAGNDTFVLLDGQVAANGVDQYDGGTGVNTILGGTGYTTLSVMSGLSNLQNIQVLNGGDSNPYQNKILATSSNDLLDFSAMTVTNFTIDAAEGDDTVTGTSGNDWILGGAGNDVLNGGAGNDTFVLLDGQGAVNGLDQYDGGTGTNAILGGASSTTLNVVSGLTNLKNIQVLNGGDSNPYQNKIQATSGNDMLDFSEMTVSNFTIDAAEGDDTVTGTSGNDWILGGSGNDVLNGGAGNDTFVLLDGQGLVNGLDQYDGGTGVNTILGGASSTTLNVVSGLANLKNIQVLNGGDSNPYNNQILATSGNDVLDFSAMTVTSFIIDAGEGNDTITGTSGVDYIFGGAGNDRILGGSGNDMLNGGVGDDIYVFGVGDGADSINDLQGSNTLEFSSPIARSDVSFTLSAGSMDFFVSANGVASKAASVSRGSNGQLSVSFVKVGGQTYEVFTDQGGRLSLVSPSSSPQTTGASDESSMSRAAYVPSPAVEEGAPVLDRWMVMQSRLAFMPNRAGTASPELYQADMAQATYVVSGASTTRMRLDHATAHVV